MKNDKTIGLEEKCQEMEYTDLCQYFVDAFHNLDIQCEERKIIHDAIEKRRKEGPFWWFPDPNLVADPVVISKSPRRLTLEMMWHPIDDIRKIHMLYPWLSPSDQQRALSLLADFRAQRKEYIFQQAMSIEDRRCHYIL